MTLAETLSAYTTLNLLLVFCTTGLWLFRRLSLSASAELKLHYGLLTFLGMIMIASPFLPSNHDFQPPVKIWSADSLQSFPKNFSSQSPEGFLRLPTAHSSIDTSEITFLWIILAILVFTLGLWRLGMDFYSLHRIRSNSYLVRRIGQVAILSSEHITVPFSYYFLRTANVIMPSSLLNKKCEYHMAIAHELQHHRQRDTIWVYPIWFLRILCVPNPFVHAWSHMISEIQEFACDEVLVDLKKVSSPAYARCLIEVAQTAIDQKRMPVCATGLTFLADGNLLTRRIEKMITTKKQRNWSITLALGASLGILLGLTAIASKDLVQDRRVTRDQAQEMAKAIDKADFPIVINDRVLGQLNRYLGTPEGREHIQLALARMENYRETIESKLQHYHIPNELLAVPIVESAYQNLPESHQHGVGAGLWMFIQNTARKYGMKVDEKVDQRLDTEMETDAAARYLLANHARFQD